jgi:hypothetical protein
MTHVTSLTVVRRAASEQEGDSSNAAVTMAQKYQRALVEVKGEEEGKMAEQVRVLRHVTVEFSLHSPVHGRETAVTRGRHRFLYGVQSWIPVVDQKLEGLSEGQVLDLSLEREALEGTALAVPSTGEGPVRLEVRILGVQTAEPREVIKALAAKVHCCDHCEGQ